MKIFLNYRQYAFFNSHPQIFSIERKRVLPILILFSLLFNPFITWAQFTSGGPQPGDVYKEYVINLPQNNKSWRVTDPNSTFVGEDPENSPQAFIPNPTHSFSIDDFTNVERVELIIDLWGGHVGTTGKQIRFNSNAWIDIPELNTTPSAGQCYTQQLNYTLDIPVGHLASGNNTIQGNSDDQTCFSFNWGQWGWYGAVVRVYYSTDKGQTTGQISSIASGGTFTDNPIIQVSPNGSVSRIDVVAKYDGYDVDGDGYYNEWVEDYNRRGWANPIQINSHVGTITSAPYQLTWNTEWIPDQSEEGISLVARIRDDNGYWYVTDAVENLTLYRENYSVRLYKPQNVSQNFWVRDGQTKTSRVNIPTLVNASQARAHIRTWNARENAATYFTQINGYTFPAYGRDHFYAYDFLNVPIASLINGTNTFTFNSATTHHGIEILWPGPAVSVKYGTFSPGTSISVAQHPKDTSVSAGQSVVFSVVANSSAPLSYQWRLNGVNIPGATSSEYTTPAVTLGDHGNVYSCVIGNGSTTVASKNATLSILGMPVSQLVLDLPFSGDALDQSGYSNNGITQGGITLTTDIHNVANSAYLFDGTNDYIEIPHSPELSVDNLTLSAWIRIGSYKDDQRIISKEISTVQPFSSYTLLMSGTNDRHLQFRIGVDNVRRDLTSTVQLPLNNWVHVTGTYDGTNMKIYINGQLDNSANHPGAIQDTPNPLILGNSQFYDRHFDGKIDEVKLFRRALNDDEVEGLYQELAAVFFPEVPSNLSANVVSGSEVELSWTDNSGDENGFIVERRQNSGPYSVLTSLGANVTGFHDVTVTQGNSYFYRVRSFNAQGQSSPSNYSVVNISPQVSPVVDVWYGDVQNFGGNGNPQNWINVLGNVEDLDGTVTSLSYRLNGGSPVSLNIGPDGRRLQNAGDFNADIAVNSLVHGSNLVEISATDNDANTTVKTIILDYSAGNIWAENYQIDWSTTTDIQDVAQVVDGHWTLTGTGLRTAETGYDRLVAIGDINWINYEVTVPVTVHGLDPTIVPLGGNEYGIGLLMRWTGHTDTPAAGWSPKSGWEPYGEIGWLNWDKNSQANSRVSFLNAQLTEPMSIAFNTPYVLKFQVFTASNGSHRYNLKVWEQGEQEPEEWNLSHIEGAAELGNGSFMLIAHHVDATFGNVSVSPLFVTLPDAPDNLVTAQQSPTEVELNWTDNSNNEENFVIERRLDGGSYSELETVSANVNSHVDATVEAGNTYQYRVKSVNSFGESGYSNEANITVFPAPDAPDNLVAVQQSVSEVSITWSDNSDNEDNFILERRVGGGSFSELATLNQDITTYQDETVTPGNTYGYRVKAVNTYGESAYSATANVVVLPAPNVPLNFAANQTTISEVVLSWEDNSDNEDNFVVERRVNSGIFSVLATLGEDIAGYEDQVVSVGNTYEYRIKATNLYGESAYSTAVSITVLPAPLAPGDLTAIQQTVSEVEISWEDNSDNEDNFVLERRVNGGSFSVLTTLEPNSTSYSDEGVTPGNTYGYRVKAVNAVGESSYSGVANVTIFPAPDAPGSLIATQMTVSEVELSWADNSDNEDSFVLERRVNSGSFSVLITLGSNVTGYSDESVTPGNTYRYRVKATNAYGESAYSSVVNVNVLPAPDAPGELIATQLTTSEVALSWTDNSDNEDNFILERRVNSGSFSVLTTLVGNVTGYSDETVIPGNTYRYRVKATNAYGESAYSGVASVTVLPAPDAPGSLTATQLTTTEVELSWTDNSNNEDNFVVERRVNNGGFSVLATLSANVADYIDETVVPGNTYRYRVKATNAYGESAYSGVANVTVLPAPDAPGSLTATQLTTTEVELDWSDNSDNEDNFVLERRVNGGSFSTLTTLGTNTTGYTDATVTPGNTYGYRVKATNAYGESAYSGVANVTVLPAPDAPGSLMATQLTTTEVELSWSDNSDNEDNFVLERRVNGGSFSTLTTLGTNTTSYTDEGVTPGNTYGYRVKATNAYGESAYSGIANVTVLPAPDAPSGLAAIQLTTTEIELDWADNSDNEDNFVLERRVNGGSFSTLTTLGTNTTGYTDEGVTPGNTYGYRVKATNAYGESAYSGVANVTVLPAPDAPNGLVAIQQTVSSVALNWVDNSDNEDDFVVERRANNATFEALAILPFNTTVYTDETIAPGNFYEYRVKARNTYGDSEYSHEVELTAIPAPAAPGNIEVHQLSETEVSITWEDNSDNEDSFVLERSHNGGGYTELEVLGSNTSNYHDHTVIVGDTYTYRVKAINAVGESDYTTSLSVIILPGPAVPGSLEASQITETAIALMWTDNSDNEDQFAIERREGVGAFIEVATVSTNTTTYTDVSVMPGNTYVYRVRAINAFGESGYSNLASVSTIYAPSAPANLTATQISVNQVSLSWIDNSDNEETFVLERRVNGSAYSELMVLGANEFGYDDVEVEVGDEYEYRIKAVNSVGESSYSNIAAVAILPAPMAPGNLTVSQASIAELTLDWDDMSDNEEGFVIERRVNGGAFTELSTISQNISNFSDQSVAVGNTYEYRVKAVNAIGESGYSNTAGVTVIITSLVAGREQHVSLYPNPLDASKRVQVHFQVPVKGTLKYQVFSLKGEVLGNTTVWLDQNISTLEIDLSTHISSTGVYFLRITDDQELDALIKMVYR